MPRALTYEEKVARQDAILEKKAAPALANDGSTDALME